MSMVTPGICGHGFEVMEDDIAGSGIEEYFLHH